MKRFHLLATEGEYLAAAAEKRQMLLRLLKYRQQAVHGEGRDPGEAADDGGDPQPTTRRL